MYERHRMGLGPGSIAISADASISNGAVSCVQDENRGDVSRRFAFAETGRTGETERHIASTG